MLTKGRSATSRGPRAAPCRRAGRPGPPPGRRGPGPGPARSGCGSRRTAPGTAGRAPLRPPRPAPVSRRRRPLRAGPRPGHGPRAISATSWSASGSSSSTRAPSDSAFSTRPNSPTLPSPDFGFMINTGLRGVRYAGAGRATVRGRSNRRTAPARTEAGATSAATTTPSIQNPATAASTISTAGAAPPPRPDPSQDTPARDQPPAADPGQQHRGEHPRTRISPWKKMTATTSTATAATRQATAIWASARAHRSTATSHLPGQHDVPPPRPRTHRTRPRVPGSALPIHRSVRRLPPDPLATRRPHRTSSATGVAPLNKEFSCISASAPSFWYLSSSSLS